jgi:Pyridoxamine 5'-phosphate oxidase
LPTNEQRQEEEPALIELTDEMKAAFATALTDGAPVLVATAGGAGMPNMAYKGSFMVFDKDNLAFWERAHGTTLGNMTENPQVCVFYRNPATRLAWKMFGVAEFHRDGPTRQSIMDRTIEIELSRDPERKGIGVLIRIDKVLAMGQVIMQRE